MLVVPGARNLSLRRHYPGQVQTVGGSRVRPLSPSRLPLHPMLAPRPCQTYRVSDRRQRLAQASLYLVCHAAADEFLAGALRGGVQIVQLRCKHADDDAVLIAAPRFASLCEAHGALFILNDRPDLALRAEADGVHLG